MNRAQARHRRLGHLERVDADDRSPRQLVRHPDRPQVRADFEHALPALGSDFHYWLVERSTRSRRGRCSSAITSSSRAASSYGHNLPFQQEFTDRRHVDARLAQQRVPRRLPRDRQPRVLGAGVHDLRVLACAALTFFDSAYTTFTDDDEQSASATTCPNSAGARARRFQELGGRRNALLSTADRVATSGPRFWVWSRSS